MEHYQVTMQHSEKTLRSLAHMQVDLFNGMHKTFRSVVGVGMVLFGMAYTQQWWGLALVAFGCIYATGTYGRANKNAMTVAQSIRDSGMDFPKTRYTFLDDGVQITALPEREGEESEILPYSEIIAVGEDWGNFYLFPNQFGGYVIPKEQLGENVRKFKGFIQDRTGRTVRGRQSPMRQLINQAKDAKKQKNKN